VLVLLGISLPASGRLDAGGGQILPVVDRGAPVPAIGTPVPLPPPVETPQRAPFVHAWTVPLPAAVADGAQLMATPQHAIVVLPGSPATMLAPASAGRMEARSLADGSVVWTEEWSPRAVLYGNGLVYGVTDLQVFAVAPDTGALQWMVGAGEAGHGLGLTTWHLLVLSDTHLRAYGRNDGTAAWRVELPAPPSTAIATSASLIVLGLQDRSVLALEAATGRVRWQTRLDDTPTAVTAAGARVYLTLPRVALCALMAPDGGLDWCTMELRVPAVGAPAALDGRLELALKDTTLRAFTSHTGTMLRTETLGARALSAPVHLGPQLVIPLSPNGFAVVEPGGTITRVPAPPMVPVRSTLRAAVSVEARALVTLNIDIGNEMSLSVYAASSPPASPSPAEPGAPATQGPAPDG
jgi:hypothetical protein